MYTKGECTCKVVGFSKTVYCPLHEAAPDMYEALRLACVCISFKYADSDIEKGAVEAEANYGGGAAYAFRQMRQALAKAGERCIKP